MNKKEEEEMKAAMAKLLDFVPEYFPDSKAFVLDERAKRIVEVRVISSNVKLTKGINPDEELFDITVSYDCKAGMGTLKVQSTDMIRTFKEASYKLGLLSIEELP